MENWIDVAIWIVETVFTVLITVLIPLLFAWLRKKSNNDALTTALFEAERIADQVVYSMQQTVVDGLKEKSKDGKLNYKQGKEIMRTAMHNFFSEVSSETLKTLNKQSANIEQYVTDLLESRLRKMKDEG